MGSAANTTSMATEGPFGEVVIAGDQTSISIEQLVHAIIILNHELSTKYGEVRTITDVSGLGDTDVGARTAAVTGLYSVSFDKLAFVGATGAKRKLVELIVGLSGKSGQIKFFESRSEAAAWLSK
jgi:hypothetical protein